MVGLSLFDLAYIFSFLYSKKNTLKLFSYSFKGGSLDYVSFVLNLHYCFYSRYVNKALNSNIFKYRFYTLQGRAADPNLGLFFVGS